MRFMVFDTETTGLPNSKIMNPDTLHLWPHIVQFSYVVYDTDENNIIRTFDEYVALPEGHLMPEESSKLHGITNTMCSEHGKPMQDVLNNFFNELKTVDILVGHNISFDINMIKVELLRLIYVSKSDTTFTDVNNNGYLHFITNYENDHIYCTMLNSIKICSIKAVNKSGKEYNKYPKLNELHKKLFDTEPKHLHNSYNDILVTLRCFMKLKFNNDLNITCKPFLDRTQKMELF